MPLDTRIALSGQPLQLESPLAQYGQLMSVVNAGNQNQLAQMQMQEQQQMAPLRMQEAQSRAEATKLTLDKANEARNFISQTMAAAEKNSGGTAPKDPLGVIKAFLGHPSRDVQEVGTYMANAYQLLQDLESDQTYVAAKRGVAGAPAALPAAPTAPAAPMIAAPTAQMTPVPAERSVNAIQLGDGNVVYRVDGKDVPFAVYADAVRGRNQAQGANAAIAAMPAPAAMAAPVNALAPTANINAMAAPVAKTAADIKAEIDNGDLQYGRSKKWAKERELLVDQYKEAIKPPTYYNVEGALVGRDGKPIYTAPPKTPTLSDVSRLIAERNAAVAANAPPDEIAALNAAIKKATTPAQGTTVNVNAGSKAEEVEFGQYVVNQYKDISARADVATRSIPALDINLKTLDKGFDTGFGTETIAAGAKVLAALGVQNAKDFATDAQTFLANANSAVLQKQLEQKGVQTAADADRITSTGAQLGNTKEANKFILSVAKAQLQRDVAQRKFYSDWRDENKTFRGAEDAWYAGPGGASLFESPILKKYAEPIAGQTENRTKKLDEIFKKAP